MSNKPEMDRKVPSFPILFKRSTVPPIHIKLSVCKFKQLSYDVEENMEEAVKSSDPHDRVRNGQS